MQIRTLEGHKQRNEFSLFAAPDGLGIIAVETSKVVGIAFQVYIGQLAVALSCCLPKTGDIGSLG
jgi:hypothetical protein